MQISFSPPDITEAEINAITDVLKSGWITTGPKTKQFEREIAAYCGAPKAACLSSATAAMELTLRILGVGPGDEVITSAYTYTASASVICHVGATPILIDTQKDSYEMDYAQLEAAITTKTKVIIPVDIGGVMCDYDIINHIAERARQKFKPQHEIQEAIGRPIIMADAAHSFGSMRKGKMSGTAADFTCFSFHAVKNLTTAEGGAVTWNNISGIDNTKIYNEFMLMSLHGQSKDALAKIQKGSWEYDIVYTGYKCNMTDIMAAFGLAQLQRYPAMLQCRQAVAEQYNEAFKNENLQILQHSGNDYLSNHHLYMVRLLGQDSAYRNQLITQLAEQGITANVHFKPLPMHTAYKRMGFDIKDYPNALGMFKIEITLPSHSLLNELEVDYIAATISRHIKEYAFVS